MIDGFDGGLFHPAMGRQWPTFAQPGTDRRLGITNVLTPPDRVLNVSECAFFAVRHNRNNSLQLAHDYLLA